MKVSLLGAITALALVSGASLSADVTVAAAVSGKGLGAMAEGASTTFLKGGRMRTDSDARGEIVTVILDLDAQRMISFNNKKKEAEVHDLTALAKEMSKRVPADGAKTTVTPNGRTKTILGRACDGYDVRVDVPMSMGQGMDMAMVMNGVFWIAKGAPGTPDHQTFYRTAAEKGMFFTSPQQAKAAPGQAKGMAEMYRAIADIGGVPHEIELSFKMDGGGPMGAMMSKLGGGSMTTTVTSISVESIDDSVFTAPAGYTIKNR
jgi:hypothetical protein